MDGYKVQFKTTQAAVMSAFRVTWKKNQQEEILTFPSGARLLETQAPFSKLILFTIAEPNLSKSNLVGQTNDQIRQACNDAVMEALKYTIGIVSTKEDFKDVQFRVIRSDGNY